MPLVKGDISIAIPVNVLKDLEVSVVSAHKLGLAHEVGLSVYASHFLEDELGLLLQRMPLPLRVSVRISPHIRLYNGLYNTPSSRPF